MWFEIFSLSYLISTLDFSQQYRHFVKPISNKNIDNHTLPYPRLKLQNKHCIEWHKNAASVNVIHFLKRLMCHIKISNIILPIRSFFLTSTIVLAGYSFIVLAKKNIHSNFTCIKAGGVAISLICTCPLSKISVTCFNRFKNYSSMGADKLRQQTNILKRSEGEIF